MKSSRLLALFLCLFSFCADGQTNSLTPPGVDHSLDDILDHAGILGAADFFSQINTQFFGTNLADFSHLREVAQRLLPVLSAYEETAPYAVWLSAHMDDFEAAQAMLAQARPQGQAPPPVPALAPYQVQRSVWAGQLRRKPWPPLAKTYVPQLRKIFAEEKVPPAMVWVAGVESSFDPNALSPAGAAGMFQLMPATARLEHLSMWPFDQRYQPDKSAHAAARYLRSLYHHYGEWPLALAAYNVGERRVDRTLREHRAHSFEAISPWLPIETQFYVPKVEATIRERTGFSLSELTLPPA